MRKFVIAPFVIAIALALGACNQAAPQTSNPVAGFVTDMHSFDAFIATHPTPDQFHQRYPDVQLVLPGTMTTMEVRANNSRYFAELDKEGRITGGRFG
ncbi:MULTISPECIES: hypothetical protein [Dyella]|uniref:Uncharacterized protein n=2 Tax=Dyella TaxID=231454 RepID=A0A4R0YR16_9GAMM|nr:MULTISPECIES: hypothetical protein [Dyella]TBR35897.1 hypothetical protein EYV96_18070 [Dyella terrae]TCI08555.1 hypothetical protein EZM97_28485 [Dyella soli]